MPKRSANLYLQDILTSIDNCTKYTHSFSFSEFCSNQMIVDAVVRNLEIIGEAARNLPSSLRSEHPNIPWVEIIGMRNKVIHEYSGVDLDTVWKTVKEDLLSFRKEIEDLSNKEREV